MSRNWSGQRRAMLLRAEWAPLTEAVKGFMADLDKEDL